MSNLRIPAERRESRMGIPTRAERVILIVGGIIGVAMITVAVWSGARLDADDRCAARVQFVADRIGQPTHVPVEVLCPE